MPNPDSGNFSSELANKPSKFKRKASGSASIPDKTVNWPGLSFGEGPNRSAGVTKLKIHPVSKGI